MARSVVFVSVLAALLALILGHGHLCHAQQPTLNDSQAKTSAAWEMESVVLRNGTKYEGLIVSSDGQTVEFMEIRRPSGKPMFLLIRPIERDTIQSTHKLPAQQRELLRTRIKRFKNRALIEARKMENIELRSSREQDITTWIYPGQWFHLESTLDKKMTQRCIVRLEQMFLAFRQVLPPKVGQKGTVRVRVYGSQGEYFRMLRSRNIVIRNPAYYDARLNLVVAASNVREIKTQLASIESGVDKIRAQLEKQDREFPQQLKALAKSLADEKVPDREIRKIVLSSSQKWEKQRKELERTIATANRKNDRVLDEMIGQMLSRVYHEAFHAYLDNYVYDQQQYDIPRWLNEGLAQIFEAGLLEADTLRVDGPNPAMLRRLQADLTGSDPLDLTELLKAPKTKFLVTHDQEKRQAAQHYLYSWGVAHYLTFREEILDTPQLDTYVSRQGRGEESEVDRFETFVNSPIRDFQHRWRTYMLSLKP